LVTTPRLLGALTADSWVHDSLQGLANLIDIPGTGKGK